MSELVARRHSKSAKIVPGGRRIVLIKTDLSPAMFLMTRRVLLRVADPDTADVSGPQFGLMASVTNTPRRRQLKGASG